ncbi:AraC-like transcriptional regulator QhpR [Rhodoligotrophos defluvii]|uniref:AraC-like transcriptional regulator QhpR n=1 Tax=Rhodoligotrophos defluvii TaxID=2561934 RepID=UPI0014856C7D|nr:AraC family transcriptional regulator [Rhodoligotrophos defluvii]
MALPGRTSSAELQGARAAPVVLAAAATGLVDFIGMQGGDADEIFGRCGIAPDMITAPTLQLRLDVFCKLFEQAAHRTGCDNFGLLFGQQFQPRDLGIWGYAALSAPTLGSALETLVELFRYQQSSSVMRFRREDEKRVRLEYQIRTPAILARRQDAELSLGQFTNLIRECCGRTWSPIEIQFEHPRPAEWRQHTDAFGAPVFFGCSSNAIVFESELLSRPMPGRDLKLLAMMRNCLEVIGTRGETETLLDRIRDAMRRHLPDGAPTLEEIARTLRTTPTAIRRALADENLNLREAVDLVRFETARHYLAQRHLPLTEIAFLLGYSELSAFTRAFTRWAGVSPLRYRDRSLQH